MCGAVLYRATDSWVDTPQNPSVLSASSAGLSASKSSNSLDPTGKELLSQLQTPAKSEESKMSKTSKKQEDSPPVHHNVTQGINLSSLLQGRRLYEGHQSDMGGQLHPMRPLPRKVDAAPYYVIMAQGHFGRVTKVYHKKYISPGTHILFEGDRGIDMGCVVDCEPLDAPPETTHSRGKEAAQHVISIAHEKDVYNWKNVQPHEAQETLATCRSLVAEKRCQLDIVGAAFQYDKKKLTFYYNSSEPRVDFRSLLMPLYSIFHCRIWMERADELPDAAN